MRDVCGEKLAGVWKLEANGKSSSSVRKYLSRSPGCRAVPESGDECRTSCWSQAVAVKMERRPWTWGTLCRANHGDLINWI